MWHCLAWRHIISLAVDLGWGQATWSTKFPVSTKQEVDGFFVDNMDFVHLHVACMRRKCCQPPLAHDWISPTLVSWCTEYVSFFQTNCVGEIYIKQKPFTDLETVETLIVKSPKNKLWYHSPGLSQDSSIPLPGWTASSNSPKSSLLRIRNSSPEMLRIKVSNFLSSLEQKFHRDPPRPGWNTRGCVAILGDFFQFMHNRAHLCLRRWQHTLFFSWPEGEVLNFDYSLPEGTIPNLGENAKETTLFATY